ncbi:MAG TPA: hypothetical protein VE977_13845 [Pyrinomonadaceae bacterium]|nr:hypothetical protein [Pyrinomonadaceae bacterium]
MIDSERPHFDSALDRLADRVHSIAITGEAKNDYWKALKHFDAGRFLKVVEHLYSTYKPRWMNDFPCIKDFLVAANSLPLADSQIFHSFPCRCCDVQPHGDGRMACQCDLERCFECFRCGKCCKCHGGPIPLEEISEWKAMKEKFGLSQKPVLVKK